MRQIIGGSILRIGDTPADFRKTEGCVLMNETSKENHTKNTLCGFCRSNKELHRDSRLQVRKVSRAGKRSSAEKRRLVKGLCVKQRHQVALFSSFPAHRAHVGRPTRVTICPSLPRTEGGRGGERRNKFDDSS